jgi:hypothetical protein
MTWDYDGDDDFAVGDLTGNGLSDIIYQPNKSPLEIYRAGGTTMSASIEGNLTFLNATTYNGAGSGLVADFDSDGDDDVIALDFGGVHVFEQTDTGIAASAEPLIDLPSTLARNVQLFDIDKDGREDILVGGVYGVEAYLRQANGTYSNGTTVSEFSTAYSSSIEFAPGIGSYGAYDGVVVESHPSSVGSSVTVNYYSNGSTSQLWASPASNSTTGLSRDVQMADMSGDGQNDIVRCLENEIQIYNQTINWYFTGGWFPNYALNFSTNPWVIPLEIQGFCSIEDVDDDGYNDILTRYGYWGNIIKGPFYS